MTTIQTAKLGLPHPPARLSPSAASTQTQASAPSARDVGEDALHYVRASSTGAALQVPTGFEPSESSGVSTRPLLAARGRRAHARRVDPWLVARYRKAQMRADHFAEMLGRPRGPRLEPARSPGRGPTRRQVERVEAEARVLKLEYLRTHGDPAAEFFRVPEPIAQRALPLPRLSPQLRRKLSRIENQLAAGELRGVQGTVTEAEAHQLGVAFVGPGARLSRTGKALISADGLRQYRPATPKGGRSPVDGQPWSRTGKQANFESRASVNDTTWKNNVHLDVK